MKYNHHFFIIIWVLVYTVPVATMERNNQNNQLQIHKHNHWLNSVQEITAVESPRHVKYFVDNQLIVASHYRHVYSVNLKTQEKQTIRERLGIGYDIIGLQCNNDRRIFYNSYQLEVVKFKKEIGKPDYTVDWIKEDNDNKNRFFAWNSLKNILFVCCGVYQKKITQRNYATGICKDIVIDDQICQIMTMHPKQKVMCIADYSGNLSLRNVDDTLSKIKTIFLGSKLKSSLFCQYSLDGSCIVVGGQKEIIIVYPNKNINKFPCIQAQEGENFDKIAFHPNGSILAILCNHIIYLPKTLCGNKVEWHGSIRYWSIKTRQFIDEMLELNYHTGYDLCFSDDGSEIVVALANKCVRMHVPFAVKDKCVYSLWVLNQFKEPFLPQDVVRYNVNILFELFKF